MKILAVFVFDIKIVHQSLKRCYDSYQTDKKERFLRLIMKLGEYVQSLPISDRGKFRKVLAAKHKCSVSLVRKWECYPPPESWGKEKVSSMSRRHPSDLASIEITEDLTDGKVTRAGLRPEIWG